MDAVHPISSRLKQARESRNLSITELSKLTNIRIHIIQALDEGRLEELPKVYMRSFIKRYAQSVGIPSEEIEELMNKSLASPAAQVPSSLHLSAINAARSMKAPISIGESKNRRRWIMVMYSVLGICGIAGLYYLYAPSQTVPATKSPLAPSVVISDKDSSGNSTGGGLLNYFGISSIDSVSLEAVTSDTVWLNITTDGKSTEQLTLLPQQSKRWVAAERFLLSVGNAGGIRLKRNGQDLPPLGKLGETVRSIRITKSEFVTSASPWKSQRDTTRKAPPLVKPPVVRPKAGNATTSTPGASKPTQVPGTGSGTKPWLQKAQPSTPNATGVKPIPSTSTPPRTNSSAEQSPAASTSTSTASQRPSTGTTSTKAQTTGVPSSTANSAAVKPALTAKQRLELAEKKKRLERIRQAARKTEITPVQIK